MDIAQAIARVQARTASAFAVVFSPSSSKRVPAIGGASKALLRSNGTSTFEINGRVPVEFLPLSKWDASLV